MVYGRYNYSIHGGYNRLWSNIISLMGPHPKTRHRFSFKPCGGGSGGREFTDFASQMGTRLIGGKFKIVTLGHKLE